MRASWLETLIGAKMNEAALSGVTRFSNSDCTEETAGRGDVMARAERLGLEAEKEASKKEVGDLAKQAKGVYLDCDELSWTGLDVVALVVSLLVPRPSFMA